MSGGLPAWATKLVKPDVVVIQSGRKFFNGTPLPDQTVLDRYKSERPGVTIVRTDLDDGAQGLDTTNDADGDDIAIVTDGDSVRVKQAVLVAGKHKWKTVKSIQK